MTVRVRSLGVLAGLALTASAFLTPTCRGQSAPIAEHVHAPGAPAQVQERGYLESWADRFRGYADPENAEIVTIHQLACLIDHLDKSLTHRGQVVVKGPDVWGQNRLTQFRGEYEDQMKTQLGNFESILSSYQRRADLAALTSATSIGASLAPRVTNSRNVSTTTNVSPPAIPSANGLIGTSGLVANANSLIGTSSPLLMPSNLTSLALSNKGAASGIGVEPTVLLDERSRFLNYLHQLRRINTGDDHTDMPGYSLYLVRMPVSILPGEQSVRGKGAVVTVQAKHDLTPDLLANTFRQVVILDTAYQLMDAVTRGQYLPLSDDPDCDCEKSPRDRTSPLPPADCNHRKSPPSGSSQPRVPGATDGEQEPKGFFAAPSSSITLGGRPSAVQGSAAGSETIAIYGAQNLYKLVCAVKGDQDSWYRHDPSIVSWLINELGSAHSYMREQARNGNELFHPSVFESMGSLALARDYASLAFHREQWLQKLAEQRHDFVPDKTKTDKPAYRVRPVDILAFAIMVQSVLVDRQLKADMQVMAQRKGCNCGDPYIHSFYDLCPDEGAQRAFNAYVACKWPIHVFSLDPMIDQQNQLDLFSQRTELQLALAAAVSTGQVNFQNASTYARRLEQDLAAVNLNRTAVGFGAGETTFGWRFYPRIHTPPTQSNPRRIAGILVNNGPGPDYALKNLQIEPGPRECYALMVVPNFAPLIKFSTVTNWIDLKTHHPEQTLETTDMVRLGRKLQTARSAMQRLCDSGRYRPVDMEVLGDRIDQLEAMLPLQSHRVQLPYEADLTGSEIFSSTNSGLAPRLLTWYGEAARPGGSIFILGSGFNVRDMKVIVGGVTLKDPGGDASYDLISRNVLRVDIPDKAQSLATPVIYKDPSVVCFDCQACPAPATPADPKTTPQADEAAGAKPKAADKPAPKTCKCKQRYVIDVHVATSNGISNHLLVEVAGPPADGGGSKSITTSVTTTVKTNGDGSSTTTTQFQTTPPGIVLPPGTYLPMGGNLPPGTTVVAPGAVVAPGTAPTFLPGTVPNTTYPKDGAAIEPPRIDPSAPAGAGVGGEAVATRPDAPPETLPRARAPSARDAGPTGFDPSVARTSATATATRPGRPAILGRSTPAPRREGSTPPVEAAAKTQPPPRKSLISRVFGGSR